VGKTKNVCGEMSVLMLNVLVFSSSRLQGVLQCCGVVIQCSPTEKCLVLTDPVSTGAMSFQNDYCFQFMLCLST
jgi:hypothetical protein